MSDPRVIATDGAPEHFNLRLIAPQPWKNGAGLTREIAVAHGAVSAAGFDWRISVAEVARDAPFSAFPGVDRCIVLLRGAGLRLRTATAAADNDDDRAIDHCLDTPCAPFHFPGDVPLNATLLGGPTSDFNVMVRRGAWRAEVSCHHTAAEVPAAPVRVLLACAGEWQIEIGASLALTLRADQGVLWRRRSPTAPMSIAPLGADPGAWLLAVRLCQRLCHDQRP